MDDTAAGLDTLMERLNKPQASDGAGSVQGWRVDTVTNSVVVTLKGTPAASRSA